MSALLFLTHEDFNIQRGQKGNVLGHFIKGFSLVLFYSTQCKFCNELVPIFRQLPGTINGCSFGMINISNNKKLIEMAKNTITPITYVPYIILYIDGRPFMAYKGKRDKKDITKFVIEVANNMAKKRSFSNTQIKQDKNTSIPAYTTGKPVVSDDVCYVEFGKAY